MTGRGPERIPNAPLREAFLDSRMSASDVARALGWTRLDGTRPDVTRVRRSLGLTHSTTRKDGRKYVSFYSTMDAVVARRICDVIGADFDAVFDGCLPAVVGCGEACDLCAAELLEPDPGGLCGLCREELQVAAA